MYCVLPSHDVAASRLRHSHPHFPLYLPHSKVRYRTVSKVRYVHTASAWWERLQLPPCEVTSVSGMYAQCNLLHPAVTVFSFSLFSVDSDNHLSEPVIMPETGSVHPSDTR